jgi:exodeoxyribonuclease VII large subunit
MDTKVYSVSEITRQIKLLLEDSFPALWVEGEVSNYKPHYSGHLYLTLKDANAQVSCVMWRSRASGLPLELKDGLKVRVYGTLRLYEKSGRYQLDLLRIEAAGLGDLQIQFEQLKQRLFAEGLFDPDKKRELPRFPQKVGLITSSTGAALQDILSVARRRSPSTKLVLYSVKVQGAGSAEEIVQAINFFNVSFPVDVLIVARGGGSLEDLWSFNEEIVGRAIGKSEIPVVSAIGHEIDFTIADFVSDVRAPTPSVAAEITLPDENDLRQWLLETYHRQQVKIEERIAKMRSDVLNIQKSYSFRRPKDILQRYIMQIEDFTQRLPLAASNRLVENRLIINNLNKQLESINPHNVLSRGFSMVFKDDILISSVKKVEVNDQISIKLKDGNIRSLISGKNHDKSKII